MPDRARIKGSTFSAWLPAQIRGVGFFRADLAFVFCFITVSPLCIRF